MILTKTPRPTDAANESAPTLVGGDSTKRSPLRYPGGKSRAVSAIRRWIPPNIDELCAPFLGGGSVELACAADGAQVHGSDAFGPLANFWRFALESPVSLAERVAEFHPVSKPKFYNLQRGFQNLQDDLERAAVFFVLNRSSFSGTTLSGGMSPNHPRFTPSAIERLRDFRSPRLNVSHSDYRDALRKHSGKFLYLDPPYAIPQRLYGDRGDMHDGFDHMELASILRGRSGWALSYNDSPLIRRLYRGYHIVEPDWTYGMSANKRARELLIVDA